jgi:hypothetical protein
MLKNLVHSFMSIWPRVVRHHMACIRPSSHEKIFIVWPDLRVVAFFAGSKYLTMQGSCCQNSNWHFNFYAGSISGIKWWACSIRRVPASSADSLGWDAVGVTWPVDETWPSAAASQFVGDATGVWVGPVATAAARGGVGVPVAAWSVGGRVSSWT